MKKLNQNALYLIEQPKKALLSIIFIGQEDLKGPLNSAVHGKLREIGENSDSIYIFPGESQGKIDHEKFTNLYSGIAWIIGPWSTVLPEIFKYSIEIFKKHSGVLITDLHYTRNIDIQKVININAAGNRNPVFQVVPKTAEEIFSYYKYIREDTKRGAWEFWKKEDTEGEQDYMNYYSRWGSPSESIFLRPQNILEYLKKEDIMWTFDTWRDCFASLTKLLEMENVNLDIENINYEAERQKR